MFGIKVKRHGYFFRERGLETECMCGCIYYTPKKKVEMCENYHNDDVIMRTIVSVIIIIMGFQRVIPLAGVRGRSPRLSLEKSGNVRRLS